MSDSSAITFTSRQGRWVLVATILGSGIAGLTATVAPESSGGRGTCSMGGDRTVDEGAAEVGRCHVEMPDATPGTVTVVAARRLLRHHR